MYEQMEEYMEEDMQKGRYLTFMIDNGVFGIEIEHVSEIIGMQQITEIPEAPFYIKGIINLRGKIIPVIDLRLKFRKEHKEYDTRTCIIIISMSDILVGLIVDNVDEVLSIPDENIVLPPEFKSGYQNRYIKGIGEMDSGMKLLIDCDKLLSEDEFEDMNQELNIIKDKLKDSK